jgi:hypothetical protein
LLAGAGAQRRGVKVVRRLRWPFSRRAGAVIAIMVATLGGAGAQLAGQTVDDIYSFRLRPSIDGAYEIPPRVRAPQGWRTYRYRAAFGAGTTGFDSTNAAKRKAKSGAKAASIVAKSRDLPGPAASPSTPAAWPAPSAGPGRQDQARRATASSAAYTTPVTSEAVLVAPSPPPLHRRAWAEDDPFAPLGIQLGSFILRPAIEVGGGYDTNAPRGSPATPSAYGAVAPELLINSTWARHELTASLRGSYVAYERTPDLDRPNFEGRVNGRVDVTGSTSLGLGTFVIVSTDNPGSPNIQAGLSRLPIYTTIGGIAAIAQRFNRLDITATAGVDRTVYDESHFTDGSTASNADRDYIRYGAALRAGYEVVS